MAYLGKRSLEHQQGQQIGLQELLHEAPAQQVLDQQPVAQDRVGGITQARAHKWIARALEKRAEHGYSVKNVRQAMQEGSARASHNSLP